MAPTAYATGEVYKRPRVLKPAIVEKIVSYDGEHASWASFFYMWPEVIFRYHGSPIPQIWVELLLTALSLW